MKAQISKTRAGQPQPTRKVRLLAPPFDLPKDGRGNSLTKQEFQMMRQTLSRLRLFRWLPALRDRAPPSSELRHDKNAQTEEPAETLIDFF